MEHIHAQIAKLERLWQMLGSPMDSDTLRHKLKHVVMALDKVVHLEERERQLLLADIEDTLASIEISCQCLGTPIEAVLLSSRMKAPTDIGHELQHYANINPTYAKLDALKGLDNRLLAEVAVRRKQIKRLLREIQQMATELGEANPCQPYETYHHDLCWANVKQIDRIKRTLRRQLHNRQRDFERNAFEIHYYLTLFDMSLNPDDFTEGLMIQILKDKAPITITTIDSKPPGCRTPLSYLASRQRLTKHGASTANICLSTEVCNALNTKRMELEQEFNGRYERYNHYVKSIHALWEHLQIPKKERIEIHASLNLEYLDQLEAEFSRLKVSAKFETEEYIEKRRKELAIASEKALVTASECADFIQQLYEMTDANQIQRMINDRMAYLASLRPCANKVIRLMKMRSEQIKKMVEFEEMASDPKRLFKASFQLLQEEKWRKMCFPTLLRLDNELLCAVQEYEQKAGKPFMYQQQRYLDSLREEIAIRNANKTFFGFLNGDAHVSSGGNMSFKQKRTETLFNKLQNKKPIPADQVDIAGIQDFLISKASTTPKRASDTGSTVKIDHEQRAPHCPPNGCKEADMSQVSALDCIMQEDARDTDMVSDAIQRQADKSTRNSLDRPSCYYSHMNMSTNPSPSTPQRIGSALVPKTSPPCSPRKSRSDILPLPIHTKRTTVEVVKTTGISGEAPNRYLISAIHDQAMKKRYSMPSFQNIPFSSDTPSREKKPHASKLPVPMLPYCKRYERTASIDQAGSHDNFPLVLKANQREQQQLEHMDTSESINNKATPSDIPQNQTATRASTPSTAGIEIGK